MDLRPVARLVHPNTAHRARRRPWSRLSRGSALLAALVLALSSLAGAPMARAVPSTPVATTGVVTATGTSSIAGTVTDAATGAPIEGVCVTAGVWESAEAPPQVTACTDSAGAYLIAGLDPRFSLYGVRFEKPGSWYLPEVWRDMHDLGSWTGVNVPAGQLVTGIDAALEEGGRVEGTVTDESGTPLAGITIGHWASSDTGPATGSALTDSAGHYSYVTLPGLDHGLTATNPEGPLLPQTYDGAPFSVSALAITTGIDFQLARGATVTGRVVDSAGTPFAGACVLLEPADPNNWADGFGMCTGVDGTYTSKGVPTGSYRVRFVDWKTRSFPDQYYPGGYDPAAATVLSLTAPGSTALDDMVLRPGGVITGRVLAADTGLGVPACLVATEADSGAWGGSVCAGTDGTFRLTGLQPGRYTLVASAETLDYATTTYVDATGSSAIAVMEGQPTDVSIVMPLGGRISGTLRDATSGAPLAGCVNVELPATPPAWPTHVSSTCSDADGRYVIRALSPGTYLVNANSSHHTSFYFDGVKGPAAATPVAVAAGATATADFALPWQFDLELTLMGSPVPGAGLEVTLYGAAGQTVATTTTTTDSIARLDVPQTGTYRIGVHDPQGRFLDTYYNGKADLASSDPVTLYAGFGLHLAMGMLAPEPTGSISGLVIDAQSGLPLAGATVSAHRDGDDAVTSTQTGADGAYTLAGLSAGTYRVEFAATNHTTSWYAWVPVREWATPIVMPATAIGINGYLSPLLSTLGGGVTDAATGAPLAGVSVTAYDESGSPQVATTGPDGRYSLAVAAGSYRLRFAVDGYTPQFYGGGQDEATAQPVTVPPDRIDLDVALAAIPQITGVVTDSASGAGLAAITVTATDVATHQSVTATTSGDGGYALTLPTGSFVVSFTDPSGRYLPEFFDGARTADAATPVTLTGAAPRARADAALDLPATISGTISGPFKGQVYCVQAWSAPTTPAGDRVCVASGAGYTIGGLIPGSYRVSVTVKGRTYWYAGAESYQSATAISLASGQTVAGVDILARGRAGEPAPTSSPTAPSAPTATSVSTP